MQRLSYCTVILAVMASTQCALPDQAIPPPSPERAAFIAHFVDALVVPSLREFSSAAATLADDVAALAEAPTDAAARARAQESWRAAMSIWQRLEVYQVGPAATAGSFVDGAGLRDGIYSWPTVNPCGVDQQVVENVFGEPNWADGRLLSLVGLDALEYLLFAEGPGNACPNAAAINQDGSWSALSSTEIDSRRTQYARVLSVDVENKSRALADLWTRANGFATNLREAGTNKSEYASMQQAIDEIYAALFYVELQVKDRKLAVPAGLHIDCTSDSCPEKLESRFARTSGDNVIANLKAARALLNVNGDGSFGPGIGAILNAASAADVATRAAANADAAIAAFESLPAPLESLLVSDAGEVRRLHALVKLFTDDLKGEMVSLLGTRIPDEGAGDND